MSFFNNQAGGASGGAFGGGSGAPPASNLFGGGAAGAKPAGTGLFGGGAPAPGAAPPSTGLFGSNSATPAAAPATGGLFGGGGPKPPQNNLFGGGGAPAPAGGSNIFGSTSATPAASAPNPNPLFGGGSVKPADPAATNQPKPGGFFNLSGNTTAAPAATGAFSLPSKSADAPSTAASTGGLFAPKPAGATTPTPAASSPFSLGGNKDGAAGAAAPPPGGFFAKPAAAPGASAPAAASSPFSLGGSKDAAAPAAAPSLFAPKPDEKKDAPAALPTFSLSKPVEGDKAPALGGALSTTTGGASPVVAVAPPSMLRGKTIEEIVNKWSSELETHVREFNKFAGEVAVWDRALIENGNNLAALYSHVLAAEREQNDIDQSLDHIEQQQKDLGSTLDAYEKATQEVFGHSGSLRALDTGPADTERDKNYMLATDLHTQLDDLSGSLTQMIESVNALSLPSGPETAGDDPMGQIAQILGSHLESLQWIDGAVREVETKVTEVEKRVKDSGYNPGASNGLKRGSGYGL
ncbi:Nsp1-like C-terminal region-domain-containing protein [Mycena albidolilacea]|uniref:Nucleoporin NSP1 n=1 Tax=Mycena albidolilacea TaxID=1033008 RepID=A0AAD7AUU7_9AGAR|nr:Nsp1-like C-terminal region-domain-containing protein [Mycena albidolilacea]